jgi:DNA-directed RNA polymerase specialized sigma24 family protein
MTESEHLAVIEQTSREIRELQACMKHVIAARDISTLALHYNHGWTTRALAERMGTTQPAVMHILNRGRQALGVSG